MSTLPWRDNPDPTSSSLLPKKYHALAAAIRITIRISSFFFTMNEEWTDDRTPQQQTFTFGKSYIPNRLTASERLPMSPGRHCLKSFPKTEYEKEIHSQDLVSKNQVKRWQPLVIIHIRQLMPAVFIPASLSIGLPIRESRLSTSNSPITRIQILKKILKF